MFRRVAFAGAAAALLPAVPAVSQTSDDKAFTEAWTRARAEALTKADMDVVSD
jgi:hypothetical protein